MYRNIYYYLLLGVPIIITAIGAGVWFDDYGGEKRYIFNDLLDIVLINSFIIHGLSTQSMASSG